MHVVCESNLKIANYKGMVLIWFQNVHPILSGVNTHEKDDCHTPLISFESFTYYTHKQVWQMVLYI